MEEQQKERLKQTPEWIKTWVQWSKKNQPFLNELREQQIPVSSLFQLLYFNQLYQKLVPDLSITPEKSVDLQLIYWQELYFIWQGFMQYKSTEIVQGKGRQPPIFFHFIKEAYLLHLRHFQALLPLIDSLNEKTKQPIHFYLKQIRDALSSTPFVATNPEVWWDTLESRAQNLLKYVDKMMS